MNNVLAAGVVLWTLALGTGGLVVAGATNPEATASAIDDAVGLVGADGDVEVYVDESGTITADASTGSTNASVTTSEDGDARVELQNDAITAGVEDSANAGMCAVGLSGKDTPVEMTVDSENDSVSADVSDDAEWTDGPSERRTAAEIVEECRTR